MKRIEGKKSKNAKKWSREYAITEEICAEHTIVIVSVILAIFSQHQTNVDEKNPPEYVCESVCDFVCLLIGRWCLQLFTVSAIHVRRLASQKCYLIPFFVPPTAHPHILAHSHSLYRLWNVYLPKQDRWRFLLCIWRLFRVDAFVPECSNKNNTWLISWREWESVSVKTKSVFLCSNETEIVKAREGIHTHTHKVSCIESALLMLNAEQHEDVRKGVEGGGE